MFRSSQNTKLLFFSWGGVENDKNFHKITAGTLAEENGMRRYYFKIQLYGNNTGDFFSHILSSLLRLLKTIREFWANKYFRRILLANISKQSFSFKFRLKFRNAHRLIIKQLLLKTFATLVKWLWHKNYCQTRAPPQIAIFCKVIFLMAQATVI